MIMKARHPLTAGRRDADRVRQESPGHFPGIPLALVKELDAEQFGPCPLWRTTYTMRPLAPLHPDETTRKLVQAEVDRIGGSRGKNGRFTGRKL